MRQKRIWDASLYIPAGLFFRLPCVWCKCTPADYCCSACCECCECCDLRKSVLIAASWQFLIGGFLGATYAILTTVVLQYDLAEEGDHPVDLVLLIYLLAYWWLYFLSGVAGCCVTCDRQGILTYEQRVIVMCRAYLGLSIVDALGHLNPIVFDRNVFQSGLSRANIVLTLVPFLWDAYISYLAWSLLKKLKEQRQGLFRGKPVMRHQRKPDHIVELHTAHHLELQPPQGQVILPLAQLRLRGLGPPPHGEAGAGGASASFLAGWLNQQGYRTAPADSTLRKGLHTPASAVAAAAAGGGGGGAAAADLADGTDFGDGASSVWNMRDSSAGDDDMTAGAAMAVDLGFSDGRAGSFLSLDGTVQGPGSVVLDDSGGARVGGRDRDWDKERDSGGDGARSRSVLGSGGGTGPEDGTSGPAPVPAVVAAAPSTITDGATALTAIEEEDPGLAALGSPQRPPSPTRRSSAYPVASASAQHPGSQHYSQHHARHLSAVGVPPDAASPSHPWDSEQIAGASTYGAALAPATGAPPPSAPVSAHATQELDRRSLARSVASSTTAIAAVATATASVAAAAAANVAAWFNRSVAVAGGGGTKPAAAGAQRGTVGRSQHARDVSPGAQGRAEEGSPTPIFITGACPSQDAGGAVFELRMYSSAALPGRCAANAAAAMAGAAAGGGGPSAAHDRLMHPVGHVRHAALHHPHHHHGAAAGGGGGGGGGGATTPAGMRQGPSLGTHARSDASQQLLPMLDPVVLPIPAAAMYGSALFGRTGAPPPAQADGDGNPNYPARGVTGRAASVSVTAFRPSAASQNGFSGGDGSAAAIAAGLPTLQRAPSLQLPPPPGAGPKSSSAATPTLRLAPSLSRRAAFMKQMSIQRARTVPRGGATAAALELAIAHATTGAGAGAPDHSTAEPAAGSAVASHGHGNPRSHAHAHRAIGAPGAGTPMVSPFARQASAAQRGGAAGAGDPARPNNAHEPRAHSMPYPFVTRTGQQHQPPAQQQQQQQQQQMRQQQVDVGPVTSPTPGVSRAGRTTSPHAPWPSGAALSAAGAAAANSNVSPAGADARSSLPVSSLAGEPHHPVPFPDSGGDGMAAAWRSHTPAATADPYLALQPAAIRTSGATSAHGSQPGAAGQQQADAGGGGGASGAGLRGVHARRADEEQSALGAAEQHQQQHEFQFQFWQQQVPPVHSHQAHGRAAAAAAALQMHLPAMRGRGGGGGGGGAAAGLGAGPGGVAGRWARNADASAAAAIATATAPTRAASPGRPSVVTSLRTGSVSTPKGQRANRLRFFYSAFGAGGAADDGAGEVGGEVAAQSRPHPRAYGTYDTTAPVSRAVSNASSAIGSVNNAGIAATWAAAAAAAVSSLAHSWGALQQQQQQQQQAPQDSLHSQQPGTPRTGTSTPVARANLPFVGAGGGGAGSGGGGGITVSSAPDVAPLGGEAELPVSTDAARIEGVYNPVFAWGPAAGQGAAGAGVRYHNQMYNSSASGAPPAAAAAAAGLPQAPQAAGVMYRQTGTGAPTRFAARPPQQQHGQREQQALRLQQQIQQQGQQPHVTAGAAGVGGGAGGSGRAASGEAGSGVTAADRAVAFASMLSPLQLPALAAAARGGAQSLYEGVWNYTSRAAGGAGAAAVAQPTPGAESGGHVGAASARVRRVHSYNHRRPDAPGVAVGAAAAGAGVGGEGGRGRAGAEAAAGGRPLYTEILEDEDVQ